MRFAFNFKFMVCFWALKFGVRQQLFAMDRFFLNQKLDTAENAMHARFSIQVCTIAYFTN